MNFLSSHIRQWGLSFVQHVQVYVIISSCLFRKQLYNFKIKSIKMLSGEEYLLMWGASVCHPL